MSAETLDSPLNSAPVETVSAWRSWAELFLGVIFVPLILLIMFYLFWKHYSAYHPIRPVRPGNGDDSRSGSMRPESVK